MIMRIEDHLLESLKNGDTIFKYIPDNIGEIVYCDSSNPKAEADTKEQTRNKILWSVGIPVAIVAFCWLVFNESPFFDSIATIIMVATAIYGIGKCLSFNGTDYFVGTEGAAEVCFDKNRDNVISKKEVLYDDFEDIVTSETRNYKNGSYIGTKYYFVIYGKENENERKVIYSIADEYNQEKPGNYYTDQKYRFWKSIERNWSRYKLNLLKDTLNEGKDIGFNLYTEKGFLNNYITFKGNQVKIGATIYDKNNVKNIGFNNGNLIIENTNHSTKFFGLIEKGDKETIPLSMIGNRELFFTFFQFFASTIE